MGRQHLALSTVFALWSIAPGCSSPTAPGVSVVAAKPASPSTGSSFSYYSQPVTLVVTTGAATGGASPTSTVEVAADAAFTTVITTQTISAGANGQVSLTLDHLSPATTYYWRVKTSAGNNSGLYSSPASFSIGPLLVIQPPVSVQPLSGSLQHKRPTFTVSNAVRTGPAATLIYRFEVATDTAFSALVASGTVPEGTSQTSFVPSVDLVSGASYVWRVRASDTAKSVTSGYSTPTSFSTIAPDDGNFRYNLLVHLPDACVVRFTPPSHDYVFDDNLAVSGDKLRFTLPRRGDLAPGLELNIDRAGSQLSGTIGGMTSWGSYSTFEVWRTPMTTWPGYPTVFSGSTDNKGRLTGTFDGLVESINCCETNFFCAMSGFAWTLTPR